MLPVHWRICHGWHILGLLVEPRKNSLAFHYTGCLNLLNRDHYIGLIYSPYNCVVQSPIYPEQLEVFCSLLSCFATMKEKQHELPAKKVIKSGPNSSGFFPSPKRTEPWHPKWSNHIFWGFFSFQTPKLPKQTLNILSFQKHMVLARFWVWYSSAQTSQNRRVEVYRYTSSSSSFL